MTHFEGWTVPLLGAVDVLPLLGAIAGCHCSVLVEGKVTAHFGGWCHCRCHCSVLWFGGRGCHCRVPISVSYLLPIFQGHQFHPDTQENNREFCPELLANVTLFSRLITQKLVLAIWGLCWYYSFSRLNFRPVTSWFFLCHFESLNVVFMSDPQNLGT